MTATTKEPTTCPIGVKNPAMITEPQAINKSADRLPRLLTAATPSALVPLKPSITRQPPKRALVSKRPRPDRPDGNLDTRSV